MDATLDTKAAAAYLNISVSTLNTLRRQGKIGYYQLIDGGKVTYSIHDLDAFKERGHHPAKPAITFISDCAPMGQTIRKRRRA